MFLHGAITMSANSSVNHHHGPKMLCHGSLGSSQLQLHTADCLQATLWDATATLSANYLHYVACAQILENILPSTRSCK